MTKWILRHLTRSVKLKPWPGGTKPYLWQPVIASPVIQQRMEEPQTAVSPWSLGYSVTIPLLKQASLPIHTSWWQYVVPQLALVSHQCRWSAWQIVIPYFIINHMLCAWWSQEVLHNIAFSHYNSIMKSIILSYKKTCLLYTGISHSEQHTVQLVQYSFVYTCI